MGLLSVWYPSVRNRVISDTPDSPPSGDPAGARAEKLMIKDVVDILTRSRHYIYKITQSIIIQSSIHLSSEGLGPFEDLSRSVWSDRFPSLLHSVFLIIPPFLPTWRQGFVTDRPALTSSLTLSSEHCDQHITPLHVTLFLYWERQKQQQTKQNNYMNWFPSLELFTGSRQEQQ